VSQAEFEELVRDLHVDTAPAATLPEPDPTADALPEDLVLKDDAKRDRSRRARNRRHGRPR
jgi:hypothetical protein